MKRFLMIIKFKSDSVVIFSWTMPITLKRVKMRVSWGNTFKCVLFSVQDTEKHLTDTELISLKRLSSLSVLSQFQQLFAGAIDERKLSLFVLT